MSNLDFDDLYMIHAMDDRNNARSRAKSIEDNFGIKSMGVEEYRDKNGGFGILKGLAVGAAVGVAAAVVTGLALAGTAMAPLGIAISASLGGLAMTISMASQNEKVVKGYNEYLDGVAAKGREMRDGKMVPTRMRDANPTQSVTPEDVARLNQRIDDLAAKTHTQQAVAASAGVTAQR